MTVSFIDEVTKSTWRKPLTFPKSLTNITIPICIDWFTLIFYFQLALSAASPVYRGYLSDIDVRWTVIAQSVDDRTDEERGKKVDKKNYIG